MSKGTGHGTARPLALPTGAPVGVPKDGNGADLGIHTGSLVVEARFALARPDVSGGGR